MGNQVICSGTNHLRAGFRNGFFSQAVFSRQSTLSMLRVNAPSCHLFILCSVVIRSTAESVVAFNVGTGHGRRKFPDFSVPCA